jgi:hypothetical protein
MKYENLKPCPICGAYPEKEIRDMGRPGGHGYPGNFSYQYECPNCKLLKGAGFTDIYCSSSEAVAQAQKAWNGICDGVQKHIDKIYVKK